MALRAGGTVERFADHGGGMQDKAVHDANVEAGHDLCDYCDGTGNWLYSMYMRCKACGGSGRAINIPEGFNPDNVE